MPVVTPDGWVVLGIIFVALGIWVAIKTMKDDSMSILKAVFQFTTILVTTFGGLLMFVYGAARL